MEMKVGPASISEFLVVPGKITTNSDKSAHVSPRYEGLVTKVFVSSGDKVKKGTPLAKIERNVGISTYVLKSPISGIVLDRQINSGDYVQEDQEAFQISDLNTVWASMHVKEDDIHNFLVGKKVMVHSRVSDEEIEGKIFFVSPTVDPETRTARVFATIVNEDRRWLPGKIIDGNLFQQEKRVPIAIPIDAIGTELGRPFTFREQGRQFVKTYLRLGIKDRHNAEVLSGVNTGAIVSLSPPKAADHGDHEEHSDGDGDKDKAHSDSEAHDHGESGQHDHDSHDSTGEHKH